MHATLHTSKRDRLAIMPGGQYGYVVTTLQVLKFIAQRGQQIPINEVGDYLGQTYAIDNHRPNEPIWDLVALGLLAVENRRVSLTPTGQNVLEAEPGYREAIILNCTLSHFTAVLELLQLAAETRQPFSCREAHARLKPNHPTWNDANLTQRPLNWLISTGALRDVSGARYEITPQGRVALSHYTTASTEPPPLPESNGMTERIKALIAELLDAQSDSVQYRRLERAAAEAFRILGYTVDVRGASGDTDLVADALASDASYRLIIDTKTCRHDKWSNLKAAALQRHRQMHQADSIVVLAPDFAHGYTIEEAVKHQIVLLPVRVLCHWLELHAVTPLHVVAYRVLFETPGRVAELPERLCTLAAERERRRRCLAEILRIVRTNAQFGADRALSAETLYMLLVRELRQAAFSERDVAAVCDLLTNDLIGAAYSDTAGKLSIAMTPEVIAWALETLASFLRQLGGSSEA